MNYSINALSLNNGTLISRPATKIIHTNKQIAFVFHIFYDTLWHTELKPYLDNIKLPYDLYITVPDTMSNATIIQILQSHPHIQLYRTENRGRDVLPFLQILNIIGTENYMYLCKMHTKKSAGRELGTVWRKLLYYDLIGSNKTVVENLELFESHQDIAMITGKNTLLDAQAYYLGNREKTDFLMQSTQINIGSNYHFAGGTMFWVRPSILTPLLQLFQQDKLIFEEESGQMDHTLAHAIERFLGALCYAQNKCIAKSTSEYTQLDEATLERVADLVLSQTYAGEDVFLKLKEELISKDALIQSKTQEIIDAHKGMASRDQEIIKAHTSLQEAIALLTLRESHIKYLSSLTLKRRIKNQLKSIIPNRVLTLFGFSIPKSQQNPIS